MAYQAKFKKGDYIINRTAGCIGIIQSINKKGYYIFKEYYRSNVSVYYMIQKIMIIHFNVIMINFLIIAMMKK